jgi:DNA-binding CsgD family transcriptional regulator/PAS domain-containing protein
MGQLSADNATVLRIADRLYERAEEADGWENALRDLADELQGVGLCLHQYDLRGRNGEVVRPLRGLTAEDVREYGDLHAANNVWMARLPGAPRPADVIVSHKLYPEDELVRHRFYREFLEPRGLFAMVAVVLDAGPFELTTVNIMRGSRPGRFSDGEEMLVRRLAPHLRNVHRAQRHFAAGRAKRALLANVLDHLPTAVLALDPDLRIIVANRAAEELAATGNCLKIAGGKLELFDPEARDALRKAVGGLAAAAQGHGTAAGGSFPIGRPLLACPFTATAIPIRPLVPIDTCNGACCLLLVEDPDRHDVPPERRLMQLWGLTPAEARAAVLLASGLSLREISVKLEISFNTVRSHLKMIFLKTDTSRQGELMHLLTRFGLTVADGSEIDVDGEE